MQPANASQANRKGVSMGNRTITFTSRARPSSKVECRHIACLSMQARDGYCEKHARSYYAMRERQRVRRSDRPAIHEYEYIYVMSSPDLNAIKVGRSKDPCARRKELNIALPFELDIKIAMGGHYSDIVLLEWKAHDLMKAMGMHVRGEWFSASVSEAMVVLNECAKDGMMHLETPRNLERLSNESMAQFASSFDELKRVEKFRDISRALSSAIG